MATLCAVSPKTGKLPHCESYQRGGKSAHNLVGSMLKVLCVISHQSSVGTGCQSFMNDLCITVHLLVYQV
jgi:hypothetical protein